MVPIPTVPPRPKPAASASSSMQARTTAEPLVRPGTDDDHQGVARPGSEPRAEVERRRDPVDRHRNHEQRDADAEGVVGETVERADRGQRGRRTPRRAPEFATVANPIVAPSSHATAIATTPTTTFASPNESGVCWRCPDGAHPTARARGPTPAGDDREREEEEADEQRDPPRDEPAANPRRTRAPRSTLVGRGQGSIRDRCLEQHRQVEARPCRDASRAPDRGRTGD